MKRKLITVVKSMLLLGVLFIVGCVNTNKEYTISFNSNGGTRVFNITTETLDESLKPNDPTKLGYTFIDWFKDEEFNENFTFTETLKGDVVLYAKWEVNKYTISFNSNGGTVVSSITNDFNSTVDKPVDPIKEGYSFAGWFSDIELNVPFEVSLIPAEDITLYAKWQINPYTISFESNGGTNVVALKEDYGTAIVAPKEPSKDNKIFVGWFTEEELLNEYVFTTMPAEDLILYAKWEDDPEGFVFEETEAGLIVTGYNGDEVNVVIPKRFNGNDVVKIGENAFANRNDIKSIYIPETIIEIGNRAFYRNTSLEIIFFAVDGNLLYIGNEAFKGAKALTSINIPNTVLEIGIEAFYEATGLKSVTFEKGIKLTNISESMFYGATSLESISLPKGIVSIDDNAFIYATNLLYVFIPYTVKNIGRNAFYEANRLETVEIEDNSQLETIGWYAFLNTNRLTSIFIPKTVTTMGNFVFYFCGKLTIYVEAESKPEGWEADWNRSNRPIVWGYSPEK